MTILTIFLIGGAAAFLTLLLVLLYLVVSLHRACE